MEGWRGLAVAAALLLAGLAAAAPAATNEPVDGELCFNELQVLGTHNSYHLAPPQELFSQFGALAAPLQAWQYSMPPLAEQLESGVRALELDAYWDPQPGGRGLYGQAALLRMLGRSGWLADDAFRRPGFKVLHIPDFDFRSSCVTLADCLREVDAWSAAHPGHLPIRLYMEAKGGGQLESSVGSSIQSLLQDVLTNSEAEGPSAFVQPLANKAQTFRDLNAELAAAFGTGAASRLLTPADVRSALGLPAGADLAAALRKPPGSRPCPWPPLGALRGKIMPVLILHGGSAEAAAFQEAFPDLDGSLMWVEQGDPRPVPGAVFRAAAIGGLAQGGPLNVPTLPSNASDAVDAMAEKVRGLQAEGYLVRARADADTLEARAQPPFVQRRDALLAAGAHVLSSDFVTPAAQQLAEGPGSPALYAANNTYAVALPGGLPARCLPSLVASSAAGGSSAGGGLVPVAQASESDGIHCGPVLEAADGAADGGGSSDGSSSSSEQPPPAQQGQLVQTNGGGLRSAASVPALALVAAGLCAAAAL